MKKSDLHREWARVLDMCEGTDILPIDCLKIRGKTGWHPDFHDDPSVYEFALAILENKPVFVGDVLYWSNDGNVFDWKYGTLSKPEYYLDLTWGTTKKKTFFLNGVELPCPDCIQGYKIGIGGHNRTVYFHFNSIQDASKVEEEIVKILQDASK